MRQAGLLAGMVLAGVMTGCKPPPTDEAVARVSLAEAAGGPSAPLPSPDTTGAIWAQGRSPLRLVYGVPGKPVLLALECLAPQSPQARIRITRHAPADSGAGALLALIGNGRIGRFEVDATPLGDKLVWQGEAPALAPEWDALKPEREATVTVPGAGLVKLNPGPLPMQLVETCRGDVEPVTEPPAPPVLPADPA